MTVARTERTKFISDHWELAARIIDNGITIVFAMWFYSNSPLCVKETFTFLHTGFSISISTKALHPPVRGKL